MDSFKDYFRIGKQFVVSKNGTKFIGTVVDNDSEALTVELQINNIIQEQEPITDNTGNEIKKDETGEFSITLWEFTEYNPNPVPAAGGSKRKRRTRKSRKVKRRRSHRIKRRY